MSTARPYLSRSARFVYEADEKSHLRFAPSTTKGEIHHAIIRDLSDTGLSFALASNMQAPEEGELLKVEFPIPGRKNIACFATVVRVDAHSEWDPEWGDRGHNVIGLQFRNLPALHLRSIKKGLEGRVSHGDLDFNWQTERRAHAFAWTGFGLAMVLSFFAMTSTPQQWLAPFKHFFSILAAVVLAFGLSTPSARADIGDSELLKSDGSIQDPKTSQSNLLIFGIGDRSMAKSDDSVATFHNAFQIGIETVHGKPLKLGQIICSATDASVQFNRLNYVNKIVPGMKERVPVLGGVTPLAEFRVPMNQDTCERLAAKSADGSGPMLLLVNLEKSIEIRSLQRP